MTLVWRERGRLYRLGVAGVVIATLAYGVGQVAPFWVKQDGQPTQINIGLWFQCRDGSCSSHSFEVDQDPVKAARILQVLGLLGLVTSVVVAIIVNCRRQHPGPSFLLEVVITLGAVLGYSGAMVYLAATLKDVDNSSSTHYDWAFALNIAASLLALVSALFILIEDILSLRRSTEPRSRSSSSKHGLKHKRAQGAEATSDGEPPFREPPKDYPQDSAVYYTQGPEYYLPFAPAARCHHGRRQRPEADGVPGRGWRKVTMNLTPSRRSYEDQGHWGVRMQPGGPVRPGQAPVSALPSGAFLLPRVVVRGFYEPGYGYPEYTML